MNNIASGRRRAINAQIEPIINIKVIGVGGAGGNAVETMVSDGLKGVEFIAANTDLQQLQSQSVKTLLLGENITKGLGAGGKPEIGEQAALDTLDEIRETLTGAHMVFIAVGLGGGTGTGAAPIIAKIAKEELGCLTIAVATLPFDFEKGRVDIAYEGLKELKRTCDGVVIISNQRISDFLGNVPMKDGFKEADSNLRKFVQSVSDIITRVAYINIDFADIKSVLENSGIVLFGIAAEEVEIDEMEENVDLLVSKALDNPLLLSDIKNARGIIVNVTHAPDVVANVHKAIVNEISSRIENSASKETQFFWGVSVNDRLDPGCVILTIIGSNFTDEEIDLRGDGEQTISAAITDVHSEYDTMDETISHTVESGYKDSKIVFSEDEIFGTTSIHHKHQVPPRRPLSSSSSVLKNKKKKRTFKPSLFSRVKKKTSTLKGRTGSYWGRK